MIVPKPMQQTPPTRHDEMYLRNLWHLVQRNRLLILGIPVLVVATAAVFLMFTARVYEGAVSIRIDENRSNVAVLDALRTLSSSGSQLETEMEVLRSRTLAEQVVAELGLHVDVSHPRRTPRSELVATVAMSRTAAPAEYRLTRGAGGAFSAVDAATGRAVGQAAVGEPLPLPGGHVVLAPGALERDDLSIEVVPFNDAVHQFRRQIVVTRPNREADIVALRYEGNDPVLAQAVPNAVAATFIVGRGEARGAEARGTVEFLYEQIDTLTTQLTDAEDELRRFREDERLVSPVAEATAQVTRLVELQAQRDVVMGEVRALTTLLREVEATPTATGMMPSPARRLIAFPTLLRNPATSELLRSLAEVENERAGLLSRRTADEPEVQALSARIREIEEQLASIAGTYLQGLQNQAASLNQTLAGFEAQLSRVPAAEIEYARLGREAKVLEEIYTLMQTRLKEAEIVAAADDPTVRIVDPAILPTRPIKPNVPLSLALAMMIGTGLGVAGAFAREHLDTTVRSRDDLQLATAGSAVLGTIPRIEAAHGNGRFRLPVGRRASGETARNGAQAFQSRLIAGLDPRSPVSEAYRSLRTNITFAQPGAPPKTLVFTSPAPGEGKSTSTVNLAAMLARQGVKCLLIDADMRRGVLNDVLGVDRKPGLSEVLLQHTPVSEAVRRIEIGEGALLDFVPTGTLPPNPAELLGSDTMGKLLAGLAGDYAAILIDAPPLNVVTDAALLGTHADGVILVARAGVTDRHALHYAMEQIRAVRAPFLGSVLNDVDASKDRYYGAYSADSY
jgi:capsular exopolysaccharide synthesis family protein